MHFLEVNSVEVIILHVYLTGLGFIPMSLHIFELNFHLQISNVVHLAEHVMKKVI